MGVADQREWREIKSGLETGKVEIQAHGFLHNGSTYFTENTPPEVIHNEIYGSITAFEENLGYCSIVSIWPGGDFTAQTVVEVPKAGYQLGFPTYVRGLFCSTEFQKENQNAQQENRCCFYPTIGVLQLI
jgi:hypothetical protein